MIIFVHDHKLMFRNISTQNYNNKWEEFIMKEKMYKVKYMITRNQYDIKTKSVKITAKDLEQLKCMDYIKILTIDGSPL